MLEGHVKWFNSTKGFGFITPKTGGEEIFVHYSTIVSKRKYRMLKTGDQVMFEATPGIKGLQTKTVIAIN